MSQTVMVTGGFGFLGRAVARCFKRHGYRVIGIGHGRWASEEATAYGFDAWLDASVTLANLLALEGTFDVVVHCCGNGSVSYSLSNPLEDFDRTVRSTADLLEFMRLSASRACLIYPSSAAVYGSRPDRELSESEALEPISPYGVHKKIVEEMLASYSSNYGLRIFAIRFFSLYGAGLTKQLLWDASTRLCQDESTAATFWGTGEETRDWIHADDATALILAAASPRAERFSIINGGSGRRITVRETLQLLRAELGARREILFNDQTREGDPRFYLADVNRACELGWKAQISLESGIRGYAQWFRQIRIPAP